MLTWKAFLGSLWRLYRLSVQIVFHRKILFMCLGMIAYYGILYAFAVFRPDEGFSVEQALLVLVEVPGSVLAIYLTMDMVAGERDKDTLEILFSTSTSHYSIWIMRLFSIYLMLVGALAVISSGAYFLFAEFPYVLGAVNAFAPAFFMVSLTFYFSVLCRSSNAAGMLAMGILVVIFLMAESLQASPYYLFMNPFEQPMGVDETIWVEQVFFNRLGVVVLGILSVYFALRRMEQREKLL